MRYLTKKQLININKSTVREHGGNFNLPNNFLHEDNLDYLLEAVQAEMFGEPLYPTISDKAAVYCYNIICYNIICNHIFSDGNKRTGFGAAHTFLYLNNCDLSLSLDNLKLTDFIIKVASGQSSLEECRDFFKENIVSTVN